MSDPARYGRVTVPNGFPKEDDYNPPVAPAPYFDLWLLPDPKPGEFTFLGRPWISFANERAITRGVLNTLAKHHFWGIDWHRDQRVSVHSICRALWKLFYHMPEHNRPKNFAELLDLNRDAGPRLLGYMPRIPDIQNFKLADPLGLGSVLDPREGRAGRDGQVKPMVAPQPISIQHPTLPPHIIAGAEYNPPFSMPEEAQKLRLHPSYVRQYLFPLYRRELPQNPWQPVQSGEPQERRDKIGFATTSLPAPKFPRTPGFHEFNLEFQEAPARLTDGNPPSNNYPPLPSKPKTPSKNQVNEAIVEGLMKLTYHELERHMSAPHTGSMASKIAESPADLDIIQAGMSPSITDVRVNINNFDVNMFGQQCSYRGRGPVGSISSASIDTVIVLGILCEAGCTNIDRHLRRDRLFDDLEIAFIEATNMNWDCMGAELSAELRDSFFRKLNIQYPAFSMGEIIPPWAAWAKLTRNFAQFQYVFQDRHHYCDCEEKNHQDNPPTIGNCLLPPFCETDRNGVKPRDLVSHKLGVEHRWGCELCGLSKGEGRVTERTITRLPARLCLLTNSQTRLVDHTDDFTFSYRDENGIIQNAKYRWLGGIYHCEGRLRVYWTEAERGREDPGTIRGYDPLSKEGLIIGSIPFAGKDRVPAEWLQSAVPVLIYEQVVEPPKADLVFWGANITHMLRNLGEDRPALHGHTVPPRSRLVHNKSSKIPQLSSLGDRHFEIRRPEPGAQLELNPSIGNQESNLYSLMKVNPFHVATPALFQAVTGQPFPVLVPGVRPALPPYPLPEPIKNFDSLMSSPDDYFENPQKWRLGSEDDDEDDYASEEMQEEGEGEQEQQQQQRQQKVTDKEIEQKAGNVHDRLTREEAAEVARAEAVMAKKAEREQKIAMEKMWEDWINFSPTGPDGSSPLSPVSNKSIPSSNSRTGNSHDTHMGGTSAESPRAHPKRRTGAGVEQRGTKAKK